MGGRRSLVSPSSQNSVSREGGDVVDPGEGLADFDAEINRTVIGALEHDLESVASLLRRSDLHGRDRGPREESPR